MFGMRKFGCFDIDTETVDRVTRLSIADLSICKSFQAKLELGLRLIHYLEAIDSE